jgi:hypothetical protein
MAGAVSFVVQRYTVWVYRYAWTQLKQLVILP